MLPHLCRFQTSCWQQKPPWSVHVPRRASAPALEFGQRVPGQRMPAANESTPSAACVLVPSALRLVCCFGAGQVTRSEREKKLFNILGARFWPDFGQISAVSLLKQSKTVFTSITTLQQSLRRRRSVACGPGRRGTSAYHTH